MAAPHGDSQRKLNAGFTEFATSETHQDAENGFGKSHTAGFSLDVDCTSDTLHGSLEPSILSMFENTTTAEEARSRIDEESEATLLSALSEILDSVIEETLSPFDSLPDTELLLGQRSQDSKVRRLHGLGVSNRETTPRVTRSQRSSLSKAECLYTDRQLRPRLHQRLQNSTVQRSDGEEEDLSETRRRPGRIFRIESDPDDEQQDGCFHVSLADLVRHMHPYSLRVGLMEEECTRKGRELQEEDVFVDVVGDDELENTFLDRDGINLVSKFDQDFKKKPAHLQKVTTINSECEAAKEAGDSKEVETLKCFSGDTGHQDDVENTKKHQSGILAVMGRAGRVKKSVRFAPDLVSLHEYEPDDEAAESDCPGEPSSKDLEDDSKSVEESNGTTSQTSKAKPRSISLQEYRLLRQKTLPKEERKMDHRTKWPLLPETPTDLAPIPCIPGFGATQLHMKHSPHNTKISVLNSRRVVCSPQKSPQKQNTPKKTAVPAVDPPNPVIVPLPVLSEENKVAQQKIEAQNMEHFQPEAQQTSSIVEQLTSLSQEPQTPVKVKESPIPEVRLTEGLPNSSTGSSKTANSALSSPMKSRLEQATRRNLPPSANGERQAKKQSRNSGEIGIEASDVTSLLEQFETQGLTPPATPPHQIWKPLVPGQRLKQHECAKPSPSKAIQIIEPRPLPPSKLHSRPNPTSSIPAPSLHLAFMDHDYCRTQEHTHSNKRSAIDMNKNTHSENPKPLDDRTSCEAERLSGSVLLSPESSPCRLEERETDRNDEGLPERRERLLRCSSRSLSPIPPARGRMKRRRYRGRYRHSDTSSVSSSRSSSCSSSASSSPSRSPPRKRRRSRRSESSSSSSSRSSSCSLSPSPVCERRCCYSRSSTRSFSRSCSRSHSRSRSRSPHSDINRSRWIRPRDYCHLSRLGEGRRCRKQKAIEERRVVYVGRIRGTMTQDELRERFELFGKIEDCTVHLRKHGDNYGFVTYYNTDDAFAAIENGTKLRQPDELPFDICFGGRRQFCQSNYADLDSNREIDPDSIKGNCKALDFDTLLKQAQRRGRIA